VLGTRLRTAPPTSAATVQPFELEPGFAASLLGLVSSRKPFPSIESAEAAAGFHILRPSDEFALVGATYLTEDSHRSLSSSEYAVQGGAGALTVLVGDRDVWGDDARWIGPTLTEFAGRSGYRPDTVNSFQFAFQSEGTYWCIASAPVSLGEDVFESFVASLH
jgi:hypothetical protein